MSSLNHETGFNKIKEYYEKNKNKKWNEWLNIKKFFIKSGKQGCVGIFQSKQDKTIQYIFKLSQYLNYLPQHELSVMSELAKITDFCPHFSRSIGILTCDIDPYKNKENPLEIKETKYVIEKELILTQYIENSQKFSNYIYSKKIGDDILYSTIKQVLLGLEIAQKECKLTHYDLHSNNIMMKRCSRDLVFLYILDEKKQYLVPTYGAYPIIIDYGFSYSNGMNGGYLWASLNHTDAGFISDRFDPVADPKLFLVTVSDEIHTSKKNKKSKILSNISKNLYSNLNIDWETGWDNDTNKCVNDKILSKLKKYSKISRIFSEYEYYSIDLLTSLIVLPMEPQPYDKMIISYLTFLKEFIKIENMISDPFYCLYILKSIVDITRSIHHDYLIPEKRKKTMDFFTSSLTEKINSISKFCNISFTSDKNNKKAINPDVMVCSLLYVARSFEGILWKNLSKKMSEKKYSYDLLPEKSLTEIYSIIDINIPDRYIFNPNTKIVVIDNINKKTYDSYLSPKNIDYINSLSSILRGREVFEILKQKSDQTVNIDNHQENYQENYQETFKKDENINEYSKLNSKNISKNNSVNISESQKNISTKSLRKNKLKIHTNTQFLNNSSDNNLLSNDNLINSSDLSESESESVSESSSKSDRSINYCSETDT